MNSIFHDMLGKFMEVYIDDVVVKSAAKKEHLVYLKASFERMRAHKLKMNPIKCAFGVSIGNFLGFLVHQRGIEIDKNKAKAIIDASAPKSKKQLQRLLGQVNYLRRFIANTAEKLHVFSSLLKLKPMEEFKWDDTHQRAFDQIKKYLSSPPVMMPPRKKWPMKLYLSAAEESIGAMLAQENEAGSEQAIYYLSRVLTPVECRYTPIKKLCLALYFIAIKLRVYMMPVLVYIVCQTDLIKYMLSRSLITGRIGKWALALMEFNLAYVPQKAIKGRALADFLANHPSPEIESQVFDELDSASIFMTPWILMFDGSSTSEGSGASIVIISPTGNQTSLSFFLDFRCSNNQAEYEALIIGLEILLEMAVRGVHIVGDSSLVINQISEDFRCLNWQLRPFHSLAAQLVNQFHSVTLEYRPRAMNKMANDLAQIASGVRVPSGMKERIMKITCRCLPSAETRNQVMEKVFATDVAELDDDDWRIPYILFLQHPTPEVDRRIKRSAVDYVLMDRDLYRRSADNGLLFQCISQFEGLKIMAEVHEGICGAHQAGIKMRWLIHRYGYY
ncbi:uncharacterized protein LOC132314276 [Cornus florida]|uniref:uncharacterized protein LOC132314276 n=1 Tax=Cornus florida TaxID=4283 RepID=UPI0028A13D9B|nr:uncharacterized protein LOC132314276 [Cornus florida]